ncbi:hypothetical protein LEP1GSC169_0910 [Leptospira santarosai str. HAI1349]|nr:hypothetical protein LEP1GSC169_0910 [Leptospira santarosai str. HAI1349]
MKLFADRNDRFFVSLRFFASVSLFVQHEQGREVPGLLSINFLPRCSQTPFSTDKGFFLKFQSTDMFWKRSEILY